jgi:hypothetical protein
MERLISDKYFIGSRPVLINPGYGGFRLNEYLLDQFNNIFGEGNFDSYNPETYVRSHPQVISLFEELFNQSNSKNYNGLLFLYIPEDFIIYNAFIITEYDGKENIELNNYKLAIEIIREITNDTHKSKSTKISEITEILETI